MKGFTLVELIVVTGIILFLSALVFPNFNLGEKNLALERSAAKLVQDLSRAREMAMSARKEEICQPAKLSGYGVYFNLSLSLVGPDRYQLRALCTNSSSKVIEVINFEKGVKLQPFAGWKMVNFYPPDPTVEANMVEITLALKTDLTKTKTITVNKAGLINIK